MKDHFKYLQVPIDQGEREELINLLECGLLYMEQESLPMRGAKATAFNIIYQLTKNPEFAHDALAPTADVTE